MKVTKKRVSEHFNVAITSVKQVGSKQLFIVTLPKRTVLVSYLTIVGEFAGTFLWITNTKYSPTTTNQITQFTNSIRNEFTIMRTDTLDTSI